MTILRYFFHLIASVLLYFFILFHVALFKLADLNAHDANPALVLFILCAVIIFWQRLSFQRLSGLFKWIAICYPLLLVTSTLYIGQQTNMNPPTPQNQGFFVFGVAILYLISGVLTFVGVVISALFMWFSKKLAKS